MQFPWKYSVFLSFRQHFSLIYSMAERDVIGRYRGSFLGLAWSFVVPLFMLAVYTFFFGMILKVRWNAQLPQDHSNFAVILFAGLIIFNFFSDCVGRAPDLILQNVNYVKKVVFPLEIFAWVNIFSGLFHFMMSWIILAIFCVFSGFTPHLTWLFLPVLLLVFSSFILGLTWIFSALGVYIRDSGQIIRLGLTVLLYCSPIFYPLSAVPEKVRFLFYFNPLTYIVEEFRNLMLWGQVPNWKILGIYAVMSVLCMHIGFKLFQKARRGFADVL